MKPSVLRYISFVLTILLLISLLICSVYLFFNPFDKVISIPLTAISFSIFLVILFSLLFLQSSSKPLGEYRVMESKTNSIESPIFTIEQKYFYYNHILIPIEHWNKVHECGTSKSIDDAKTSLDLYLVNKLPENNYTKYHNI